MHHLAVWLLAIIDQIRELDWTLKVFDPGLSDRCGYSGSAARRLSICCAPTATISDPKQIPRVTKIALARHSRLIHPIRQAM
jgi:hypothetical protein